MDGAKRDHRSWRSVREASIAADGARGLTVSRYPKLFADRGRRDPREVVYFVGRLEDGPIKIGTSTDLTVRLTTLQTASPYELIPLAVFPGDNTTETTIHRTCAEHQIRLEWYRPHTAILFAGMTALLHQAETNKPAWGGDAHDPADWLDRCRAFHKAAQLVKWPDDRARSRGLRAVLLGMWANPVDEVIARACAALRGESLDDDPDVDEPEMLRRAKARRSRTTVSPNVPRWMIELFSTASELEMDSLEMSRGMIRKILSLRENAGGGYNVRPKSA